MKKLKILLIEDDQIERMKFAKVTQSVGNHFIIEAENGTNEKLQFIPIVVMSTSSNQKDIKECYEIGVSGYIIKPLHYEDYQKKIQSLLDYWLNNELISE